MSMWLGITLFALGVILCGWILIRVTRRERNVDNDG